MTTAVKERSIMFRTPLVQAIREGRKSQTRRTINPQPERTPVGWQWKGEYFFAADFHEWMADRRYARIGVGDRLWVKESVIQIGPERTGKNGQYLWPKFADPKDGRRWFDNSCVYAADLEPGAREYDEPHGSLNKMFMPRWASRFALEVTALRAEQLHDITEQDAEAEGVPMGYWHASLEGPNTPRPMGYRPMFRRIWDEINGAGSWDTNPWVRVIEFKRVGGGS
jgi:hypothetical protein